MDFEKIEVEVSSSKNKSKTEQDSESFSEEIETIQERKSHDALVVEYCPKIFRELRGLDDITGIDLSNSFNPILNSESINKMRESEGKSGSFFFFTNDNNFLIKTITDSELNNMLGNFMKAYYEHIINNEETLLAKIYGIFSIQIK
jgi:1-phosphatidylinositol-4-phosphate 5-kinase